VTAASLDADALADLASKAMADGTEQEAAPILEQAARSARTNARLWQWTGLLFRSLDDHARALAALAEAARLAPGDASIAHGHARTALEAGLDARQLFDRALRLAPSGDVLLGRGAALFAAGEGEAAARELAAILKHNPLWAQGHLQWAQLSSMIGQAEGAMATIESALRAHPGNKGLWQAALHILVGAGRHAEAWRMADRAIGETGDAAAFALTRAAALSDAGEVDLAAAAFTRLGEPRDVDHAVHLARWMIRVGQWDRLARLADRWMGGDSAHHFWPYASIIWRKTGDARWEWLEGDQRLIRTFDLTPQLPSFDALGVRLRQIHDRSGRFLDQSVRGGTQTDGPLLSRIEPEIRELRAAIVEAVEEYRAGLPPQDPAHPMLRHRRDRPIRFAGSWSVRLAAMGHHSHHIHPQGWISSAFYVAVPGQLPDQEGWLTLGEPQAELGLDLPPIRSIDPVQGKLVLFPSMMWHGTLPFGSGERLTVAFDVALPR
jgi:tetratricopeptide (TPR) repeat protein